MPIKENNRIIGAVDVSRYIDSPYRRQDITLETKEFKANSSGLYTVDDIITVSPQMEEIKQRIPLIADTDSSVLIYGETGTGKELVAESIPYGEQARGKTFCITKLRSNSGKSSGKYFIWNEKKEAIPEQKTSPDCLKLRTEGPCSWMKSTPWN